ncbi:hypothetical protein [Streptomyces sp. NBC_01233]|uniref:hypothetical protein n=1 Tax=Streptomyces sp. NBC_01233 TaxID=2903787 RepID=UPI002E1155C7|nr:hypothetical protein OG332_38675 [Streptomyces sp. NBC_01233]
MRIELHIGRIVLEGVAPADAPAVRAALTSRLGDLLAQTPPTIPHHTHRLTPPTLPAPPDPTAFGHALAGAVHDGLTRPTGAAR